MAFPTFPPLRLRLAEYYLCAENGDQASVMLQCEKWTYYTIPSLPTEHDVYSGGCTGTLIGKTVYSYDGSTPVASSGVPQHVAVTGPRGNLTSISTYANGSTPYQATMTYEDTGTLLTKTTPNGTESFGYDSTFTYLTSDQLPTPSSGVILRPTAQYDTPSSGMVKVTNDANIQPMQYKYDSMLRVNEIDYPDSGKVSFSYSPTQAGQYSYQSQSVFTDTETQYDAYGRTSRVAVANGQGASPWYQQDVCYDANGKPSFASYGYQGNGWSTNKLCTGAGDTYTYDVLGRVKKVLRSNGETQNFTYIGRAMQSIDENGVTRISQVDGLGRPTIVCEISSNSSMPGSGSPSACGTDIAGTGFLTSYTYDLANGKTTVNQGSQIRVFQSDWLGRPIFRQEPESGQASYSYAYNSTGLVVTRQRPMANQANQSVLTSTTTQYDSVGRIVSVNYTDGTPTKTFQYDIANPLGIAVQNPKGRMVYAGIANAQSIFSYDPMGRIIFMGQCAPSNCGSSNYSTSYSYDWAGNLLTSFDGSSATDTYTYSRANEVQSITSSANDSTHPPNLLSNVQYGPFGPLNWQLGNGLNGVRSYDAIGRISGGWVCNGSNQTNCSGGTTRYSFASGWNGTYVTSASDSVLGQANSYGYDEFGRLASLSVNTGNPGSYSYVYDRWGNRWQQNALNGGPSPQLSFNTSNNQLQMSGITYDAAGNLLNDGSHSYKYDAEGNVIQVDNGSTANYTYNALNERVRIDVPGDSVEYIFNPTGQHTSSRDVTYGWEATGWIYWGAEQLAYYGCGQTQFQHRDWVGTERMQTTYNGQPGGTFMSLPFGDGYSANGTVCDESYHYAYLDQDTSSNEHAQFREYSNMHGRWFSPDPYSGSYDFGNPQSMNRYAYVSNQPLGLIDPAGLVMIAGCPGDGFWSWLACLFGGGGEGGGGGRRFTRWMAKRFPRSHKSQCR